MIDRIIEQFIIHEDILGYSRSDTNIRLLSYKLN
jgi:hypothetical protein